MMDKPQPIKPQPTFEIVVLRAYPRAPVLNLLAATPDAGDWIKENMPEFGVLFVREDPERSNNFTLHVDGNYVIDEVIAYIHSVGAHGVGAEDAGGATVGRGTE